MWLQPYYLVLNNYDSVLVQRIIKLQGFIDVCIKVNSVWTAES